MKIIRIVLYLVIVCLFWLGCYFSYRQGSKEAEQNIEKRIQTMSPYMRLTLITNQNDKVFVINLTIMTYPRWIAPEGRTNE